MINYLFTKRPLTFSLVWAGVILLLGFSSFCQNLKQSWQTNKQLWENKQLTNYKFSLKVECFCGEAGASPALIEVREGATKSIIDIRTAEPVEYPFFSSYDTIPKLFSLIELRLGKKMDSFSVEYDATLGYPKKISIDESRNTADDELQIEVISFEILK